jgi:predicted AAA+ superfamily ATPase
MIPRRLLPALTAALAEVPAVALLGPRQVGKTTLALELASSRPSVYLDLESEADRAKLAEPELYLKQHEDKLVILDEIHRTPQIFRSLRGLVDAGRRQPWATEIKRGLAPKIERGFHLAAETVRPERRFVVYSGDECFPLAEGVEAIPLADLCAELSAA